MKIRVIPSALKSGFYLVCDLRADAAIEAGDVIAASLQLTLLAAPAVVAFAAVARGRVMGGATGDRIALAVSAARVPVTVVNCVENNATKAKTQKR